MLKRLPFYREMRQARNALVTYGKLWPFLVNRFVAGPALMRRGEPLDRAVDTDTYTIHLLCGHGDLLGLLWALGSWFAVAADAAQVYIHEDGSFTEKDRETVSRLFPRARILDYMESTRLAEEEWLRGYPAALGYRLDRRTAYSTKLMDPLFTSDTPGVLVMDTDILWFDTPHALHDAMRTGGASVFWPGSGNPSRQAFRDGSELRLDLAALNSGIVYFERAAFRVEMLEEYCAKLPDGEKLLDQPGFAYVLGMGGKVMTLPVENYHIHGAAHGGTVGKHYTGPRREQFWFEGVERVKRSLKFQVPM